MDVHSGHSLISGPKAGHLVDTRLCNCVPLHPHKRNSSFAHAKQPPLSASLHQTTPEPVRVSREEATHTSPLPPSSERASPPPPPPPPCSTLTIYWVERPRWAPSGAGGADTRLGQQGAKERERPLDCPVTPHLEPAGTASVSASAAPRDARRRQTRGACSRGAMGRRSGPAGARSNGTVPATSAPISSLTPRPWCIALTKRPVRRCRTMAHGKKLSKCRILDIDVADIW